MSIHFQKFRIMKAASEHLIATVQQALPLLEQVSDTQASIKPAADKWSAKEITGHLIDSANNNVQKFVRTMAEDGVRFVPYEQNSWVNSQHYNKAKWEDLLQVWAHMNYHIAHVMKYIPDSTLQHKIYIGDKGPYELEFIVNDYTEHLKHHLKQILPDADFLTNSFEMVY